MDENLAAPQYAALIGLAVYGNRRRMLRDARETGLMAKLWRALRGKSAAA